MDELSEEARAPYSQFDCLPDEILCHIAQNVGHEALLAGKASLLTLNRHWYRVASEVAARDVVIDGRQFVRFRPWTPLYNQNTRSLALHARALRIKDYLHGEWVERCFANRELASRSPLYWDDVDRARFRKEALGSTEEDGRDWVHQLDVAIKAFTRHLPKFSRLEHLKFQLIHDLVAESPFHFTWEQRPDPGLVCLLVRSFPPTITSLNLDLNSLQNIPSMSYVMKSHLCPDIRHIFLKLKALRKARLRVPLLCEQAFDFGDQPGCAALEDLEFQTALLGCTESLHGSGLGTGYRRSVVCPQQHVSGTATDSGYSQADIPEVVSIPPQWSTIASEATDLSPHHIRCWLGRTWKKQQLPKLKSVMVFYFYGWARKFEFWFDEDIHISDERGDWPPWKLSRVSNPVGGAILDAGWTQIP